jgi:hypothetical protein
MTAVGSSGVNIILFSQPNTVNSCSSRLPKCSLLKPRFVVKSMRLFAPLCVAGLAIAPTVAAFVLETSRTVPNNMALRSTTPNDNDEDTMSRRTMIGNALAFSAISLIPTASQAKVG